MQNFSIKSSLVIFLLFLSACDNGNDNPTKTKAESSISGDIKVGVDESVQPVMEQQFKVWDSSYPHGKITPIYQNENENFKALFQDSVKLIISTRDLTAEEKSTAKNNGIYLSSLSLARDAAVIIIHPEATDKKMTLGMLKNIITGDFPRKYNVVFDNANSSLVKMIQDSVMKGASFLPNVYAAGSSEKVIEYVSQNKNALGIIGMTHAYDPKNTDGAGRFRKEISVVSLQNDSLMEFFEPYQVFVATMEYPLTRRIFFISCDPGRGLATGFANFLTQPSGQLIFKKSWLVPLRVELNIRDAALN